MQGTLIGVLIGYGLFWAINTPGGQRFISSTNTKVGQQPAQKIEREVKADGSNSRNESAASDGT